jgi:tetratricopeptide (TPR) repeat protein
LWKQGSPSFGKAVRLGALGKSDEAIAAYDKLIAEYPDPQVRELVALALLNKGITLGANGCADAAVAAYDELVRRFRQDESPAIAKITEHVLGETP